MSVLSLLYTTNSTKLSGGTRQMLLTAGAFAAAGHRVTILVPTAPAKLLQAIPEPVEVLTYGSRLCLSQARQVLAQTQAQVVHCFHSQLYKTFLLARIWGSRFRLFLNRGVIFAPGSFPLFYLPQLTGITCNSQAAAQVLRRLGVPGRKIYIVPNAITLPLFPWSAPRPHPAWITFVGGTKPYKGLDIFLHALSILAQTRQDFHAHIVGAGPYRTDLLGPAHERTQFHGAVPHAEVVEILRHSRIYVLASRQESQPNSLLEAMACGATPVATAVGGVPEILEHGRCGRLVPPEDPKALAAAIRDLLDAPEECSRLAQAAQARIQDFSLTARIQALHAIYTGETTP
jgi:glycosyltransferase involved in cell wall biosynthesis